MLWRLLASTLLRLRMLFWRVVYRAYLARYRISPRFRFNGAGIELYGDGFIELGDDSYIGDMSTVQVSEGRRVRVGQRCRISHNVRIYTQTAAADTDFRVGDGTPVLGDVEIGDGAWVGANVFIGPGISIGANAVVGANSVVTRNVPPDEIWGGVPARRLRVKQGSRRSNPTAS